MKRFFKIFMFPCVIVAVLVTLFLKTGGAEAAPLTCGSWSAVPSPPIASNNAFLNGVAAVSSNNVWAVGNNGSALIENWNGQQWSIVSSPNPSPAADYLYAVTRVPGTSQLWTVGFNGVGEYNQPLIEFYC